MKTIDKEVIKIEDLKILEPKIILLSRYSLFGCWKTLELIIQLHNNISDHYNIQYRVDSRNIKGQSVGCVTLMLDKAIDCYNKIKFV